jgi:secondary thiamine-phosphate synthase enzyme
MGGPLIAFPTVFHVSLYVIYAGAATRPIQFHGSVPGLAKKNLRGLASSNKLDAESQDERADGAMKSYREELWFETATRRAYINITPQVQAAVQKSRIRDGFALVNAMHITASVYINDDEPGLLNDYDEFLDKLAPQNATYRHNETGEDNGDAHIKRQIMGREVLVAITGGRLDFGPWEQIFYAEFDGRRRKRVLVKIIGE